MADDEPTEFERPYWEHCRAWELHCGQESRLQMQQLANAWQQNQMMLAHATAHQNLLMQQGLIPSPPKMIRPDPTQPDTLGWREWVWDADHKCLKSPQQETLWESDHLAARHWSNEDAVRGVAGIHAMLVPRHWKILNEFGASPYGSPPSGTVVTGIVERFGKYVLGTEGWRAEQVIIRELLAPSTEIGLELEQRYPDVIIHYSDQEGDQSCTLERSSKSGKGSRPLLPNLPASPVLHSPSSQPSPISIRTVMSLPSPSVSLPTLSPPSAKTFLCKKIGRWPVPMVCWYMFMTVWGTWAILRCF